MGYFQVRKPLNYQRVHYATMVKWTATATVWVYWIHRYLGDILPE